MAAWVRMNKNKLIRVLLVEDNTVNARFAEAMLSRVEDQAFQVQRSETLLATLSLLAHDAFDVALVDLNLPDSQGLETFRTIQRHAPSLPIIILTGMEDESAALGAVAAGAQDFLAKGSLNKDSLIRALNYAIVRSRRRPDAQMEKSAKGAVLGVLGSNGGVGTTTMACYCALELQQVGNEVLLLDLDVSSSGASLLMKSASEHTLLEACENLHRLDADLWKGIVCSPRAGVDLMQAPGAVGIGAELTAERVRHVVRFARSLYDWIVVDLGRITAPSLALLPEASDIFVVTTPHVPALYEAGKLVQRLLDIGLSRENVRLLLNRKCKTMPLGVGDIEKALGYSFVGCISDDAAGMSEAFADGRFTDANLLVRKQVGQLIRKWRGIEDKVAASSGPGFFRFAKTLVGA